MIVYNYDADLEVSDTCVRSSLLSWVETGAWRVCWRWEYVCRGQKIEWCCKRTGEVQVISEDLIWFERIPGLSENSQHLWMSTFVANNIDVSRGFVSGNWNLFFFLALIFSIIYENLPIRKSTIPWLTLVSDGPLRALMIDKLFFRLNSKFTNNSCSQTMYRTKLRIYTEYNQMLRWTMFTIRVAIE